MDQKPRADEFVSSGRHRSRHHIRRTLAILATVLLSGFIALTLARGAVAQEASPSLDPASGAPATVGALPEPGKEPSKIPDLVRQRIERIARELQVAPRLSPRASAELKATVEGQLDLEFHAAGAVGDAEAASLEALGATILTSTADITWPLGGPPPGLGVVVARIPFDQVEAAAALAWVVAVRPVENNPPDTGAFQSEGVALHNADDAQTAGITGAGVAVGAISDGVLNLAAAQASGDLPAAVTIPGSCPASAGDEGTAMLEIIHDMAPGAALLFCPTGAGTTSHIAAQNALVAAGADVITEDWSFDAEPAFQQGAVAANGDAIAAAGVSMHSSAGNRGDEHTARVAAVGTGGGPDGSVGPFDMATNCGSGPAPFNVVAIAPGGDTTFDMSVGPFGSRFTLQWSEPRAIFPTPGAGGFTDLDLYVFNAALTTCLGISSGLQGPSGSGDTIEQIDVPSGLAGTGVKVIVNVYSTGSAVAPPILDLRWRNPGGANIDLPTREGSLNPDANYTGDATSSAAANAGVSTNPNTVPLEDFSSGGPVQLISTTVCPAGYPCPGTSVAGAPAVTVGAPHWTAADGVSISGAGGFGVPSSGCPAASQGDCRFYGTSASTPHAAACDALFRERIGGTPTVPAINAALAAAAVDRGPAGVDNTWGAGVLDCFPNQPPIADADGPYVTDEGTDVALDGSGSSDPDGDPLTYAWDLDNDGAFDDATGPTPTFDMVGQDGIYPIALKVTDPDGASDVDETTVTVNNVAPSVSLSSDAPKDEGSVVTVSGTVTDPGWLDPLSGTIDWGDGTPPEPAGGVLENVRPDATLTFSVSHVYGDNGVFTAQVCASDDDTTTCATVDLAINNVNPTAEIDETGAILVSGVPTFLAHAGDPLDFSGRSRDPGSDDLFLSWDWGDGSPIVTTSYLVNPPNPDPFPSPSIQPRDITDTKTHAYANACLYRISFWAADDDGGVSPVDTANVVIVGNADLARTGGYWQDQFRSHLTDKGHSDFDQATLQCYLAIAGYMSRVFNEVRDASTFDAAYQVLFANQSRGSAIELLDRQLLAAWLNFANGAIEFTEFVDTDGDGIADTSFANALAAAEAVRLDPNATRAQILAQKNILERINRIDE